MRKRFISLDIATDHTKWLADGFSSGGGVNFSKEVKVLMQKVINNELTALQRELIEDYYYKGLTVTEIAAIRGVNKSSVSRGIKAARERIGRSLRYGSYHLWQED